jgi:hypothetical protein
MSSHEGINAAIRRAAGRGNLPKIPYPDVPREGSIGIGRGGGSAPARRKTTSGQINARIRTGARVVRTFTVPGGVNLDAIDLDSLFR